MKNITNILLIAMVFLVACGGKTPKNKSKETIKNNKDYRGAEVAFVKDGKLYFYYPKSEEIKQLEEETERVFNCVFDNTTDLIYYTVERDSMLWLKKAFYHHDKPVQITVIANLKVKKESCITDTYGEKSILLFTRAESIVLPYKFVWDYFNFRKAVVYETTVGDVGDNSIRYKEYDYRDSDYFNKFTQTIQHEVVNNELICTGIDLSGSLDLKLDEDIEEMEFTQFKFSFDNSKLIFGAVLGIMDLAHGPYCVANVDGTHQQLLVEDGLSSEFKPFWVGNQVVFLRSKKGISEDDMPVQQLCITKAEDNMISVIDEGVDYFTVRDLNKSEQPAVNQSEQFQGFLLDRQEIVTLAKPPFRATFAENDTQIQNISLQQLRVEKNNIIDSDEWFADNDLSMPRMKTAVNFYYSGAGAPLKVPQNIPQQWGDFRLIEGIKGENAHFYLYGESHMNYQHLLIANAKNTRILHFIDFGNYVYCDNNKGDFIDMRVQWAEVIDNVLYVSTSHSTYAESSKGINAFITAIDLSDYGMLWQSAPLVSNAKNFEVIGDNIVCGYGFTAEPDYLYVLNRFTGKKVQTIKLASGPSYIIRKGEKLYVRTYNRNYVFKIK